MKHLILLLCTFFALQACKKDNEEAQNFVRGGSSLTLTSDNYILLAGYTYNSTSGYDAVLVKTSTGGIEVARNSYGSGNTDAFYKVIKNDTSYIAIGTTHVSSQSPQMFVVFVNKDLKETKRIVLGNGKLARGMAIVAKQDSVLLAVGSIQNNIYDNRDIYVVKMNKKGELQWQKTYGARTKEAAANQDAYDVIAANDGGFYITGSVNKENTSSVFLMKVSDKGDSLWTKTYVPGIGYSILQTPDGQIVIGGSFGKPDQMKPGILKLAPDGAVLWNKTHENIGFGANIVQQKNGIIALTGYSKKETKKEAMLTLFSQNGNIEKYNTFPETEHTETFGIMKMQDEGYCLTGTIYANGSAISLYRTDINGKALWYKALR